MTMTPLWLRAAVRHLRRRDPVLAGVIAAVGPLPPRRRHPGGLFGLLVRAIVHQQISRHAARAIHGRLVESCGGRAVTAEALALLSDAKMRAVGLSRPKRLSLRDLAEKAWGGLSLARVYRLDDEPAIAALTQVRGIGRWTAQMMLMFHLGRPDVLPLGDLGIQKAVQRAYRLRRLPDAVRLARIAEPWRPYRTAACFYLWRSLDALPPAG